MIASKRTTHGTNDTAMLSREKLCVGKPRRVRWVWIVRLGNDGTGIYKSGACIYSGPDAEQQARAKFATTQGTSQGTSR